MYGILRYIYQKTDKPFMKVNTPKKINVDAKNWWFGNVFPKGAFSGSMLIFGWRVVSKIFYFYPYLGK